MRIVSKRVVNWASRDNEGVFAADPVSEHIVLSLGAVAAAEVYSRLYGFRIVICVNGSM